MSSSLVNSLAKVYDRNPLHGQKPGGRKPSLNGSDKPPACAPSPQEAALRCVESRMDSLSSQMERLLHMQQTVLTRLDGLSHDVRGMGRDLASIRGDGHGGRRGSGAELCREMRGAVQRAGERMDSQGRRLDGVEKLLEGTQQVISFIGEVVKSSRLLELLFKQPGGTSRRKAKDEKDKTKLSPKGPKGPKKRRPQDLPEPSPLNGPVLPGQVEKLNRQNTEHSHGKAEAGKQRAGEEEEEGEGVFEESEDEAEDGDQEDDGRRKREEEAAASKPETLETSPLPPESSEEAGDAAACSKHHVAEEGPPKDDLKKSRVHERGEGGADGALGGEGEPKASEPGEGKVGEEEEEEEEESESALKEFIIDSSPPPSAPFDHRIVTPKPHQVSTYYAIDRDEVLGGGRFGQVHKCRENSTGLTLAAKIIKARSQKEKEVVRNEIQVMNQLNHANLIQLYAAFESRHDVVLVMEYVEGGELFDRIIDENHNLTELDTVLFIRQICEGLQYMHKMYILHLDLKPENILCVSRATNKIKIIDFGLARRYKPREKLKVNFGTPEFLAPEVINYEFVSFPTDMWSLGVITYMLLSGLSPFLGDEDSETLNNILACQWNFEEEEFTDVSDEAKDFITRLLVKSKSWRMSATESLRHPWLSERTLHYRLSQKKNKFHSTQAPSPGS
ncbi:myosin light chain kinase 2, skeletal/cardiac muscle [Brachionichthys hirsutus]|uniref:myosin light chain kinase 2, skeletal/cardiac muscle n=1 Tax=Brachionichthys hirsutus TaxID=412623 RepID=UPI0036048DF3